MSKLLLVAGEASGDLNAASLATSIRRFAPDLKLSGIGGEKMREAGVEILYDLTGKAVVGFAEVLRNIFYLRRVFKKFSRVMIAEPPLALILVDYPGFNIRLAEVAKRSGIKVIYYISPQVWAWGRGRVRKLEKVVDKMLVIFDFEKDFYSNSSLDVEFVGHPALDRIKPYLEKEIEQRGVSSNKGGYIVSLLPGSRDQEVKRHLPIMLRAALMMSERVKGLQFIVACAPTVEIDSILRVVRKLPLDIKVKKGQTYEVIKLSDLVITSSGTATIECACFLKPLIVIYRVSFFTWVIVRFLIKVPNIAMVNLIAGRKIVPEFVQFGARPGVLVRESVLLLEDNMKRNEMLKGLREVAIKLGKSGASERAARSILKKIGKSVIQTVDHR